MSLRLPVTVVSCILLAAPASMSRLAARVSQDPQSLRTIALGDSIKQEIAGQQVHEYRVVVDEADTFVRLAIKLQCCVSLDASLLRPDGTTAHQIAADFEFWPHSLSYVADVAGTYRVRVRAHDPEEGDGGYELIFAEEAPATARLRDRFKAEQIVEATRSASGSESESVLRGAIDTLQTARALYRGAGDARGETDVLELTAEAHMGLGELRAALEDQRARIALLDTLGDRSATAYTLNRMRFYAQMLGDLQSTLDLAQESVAVFRSLGSTDGIVEGLAGVGNAYAALADPVRAAQAFDEADALDPSPTRITPLLGMAGAQYTRAGMTAKAIERFETDAEIARRTGRPSAEQWDLIRLAELYAKTGQRDKAVEYVERVVTYRQSQPGKPNLDTLWRLGATYLALGDREKALDYLDRALATAPEAKPASSPPPRDLAGLGIAFDALGEHEKAIRCYEESLAYVRWSGGDANREARLPARMAAAERDLGRFDAARAHIEQSMAKFEALRGSIVSPSVRSDYFSTIQDVYELYIDLLMRMHASQPTTGHAAEALNISERARGRSLMDLLTEARVDITEGTNSQLIDRDLALQRRIAALANRQATLPPKERGTPQAAALTKEIETGTAERRILEGQIRAASPRYVALTMPTPLTLERIQQQLLGADTLLLEYALGETRSYLLVVSRDWLASFSLPPRATVEAQARRVYELLTARNRRPAGETAAARQARLATAQAEWPKASAQLTDSILKPAAALLGNKRLLIVAQGALQYVPFAALPDPGDTSGSVQPAPLIVAHEIVSAPSASVVAVMRQETRGRTAAPKALAVFADPVFDKDDSRVGEAIALASHAAKRQPTSSGAQTVGGSNSAPAGANARSRADLERSATDAGIASDGHLPRLSFSLREAMAISATAPKGERLEAFGFRASKDLVTSSALSQYAIVHFATHGMLDSANPGLSGLVLSLVDETGAPKDGYLRLQDVFNLRLPASLVVLSACQTALGQDVRGEGLVGLTRAFMYAGAPRVAASLWNVDDAATADLMARFYENMMGPQRMRPAAALRAAQLSMNRTRLRQDPYYWAAFQIQGEWQ